MTKKYNFLIVDDEALIREGLESLLVNEPFVFAIQQASNKVEFLKAIESPINLVLLDFKLQSTNALDLLPILKQKWPDSKVIAVTGLDGTELLVNLLKAGVNGIVYKLDGYSEIRKTIEKVLDGESYFPEKVLRVIQRHASQWDDVPLIRLTFSEKEILKFLTAGLTTKQIAGELKMTESTTETYRNRLMKKLNVQNTAGLLAFAFRNGLL